MDRLHVRTTTKKLWGLVLLAIAYSGLLFYLPTLTGTTLLDGSLGVLLGLYICSQPAAHAVDLVFFEREALHQLSSEWPGIAWLALNLLVLFLGWFVIAIGATTFAKPPL